MSRELLKREVAILLTVLSTQLPGCAPAPVVCEPNAKVASGQEFGGVPLFDSGIICVPGKEGKRIAWYNVAQPGIRVNPKAVLALYEAAKPMVGYYYHRPFSNEGVGTQLSAAQRITLVIHSLDPADGMGQNDLFYTAQYNSLFPSQSTGFVNINRQDDPMNPIGTQNSAYPNLMMAQWACQVTVDYTASTGVSLDNICGLMPEAYRAKLSNPGMSSVDFMTAMMEKAEQYGGGYAIPPWETFQAMPTEPALILPQ